MAPVLPSGFLDELRVEVVDETIYSDNELYTFIKVAAQGINSRLDTSVEIIDSTSVYDYTFDGTIPDALWELYRMYTIYLTTKNRYNRMIAEGGGVSVSLGAERIDAKSPLISMKQSVKEAFEEYKKVLLEYSMARAEGSVVDLYYREETW